MTRSIYWYQVQGHRSRSNIKVTIFIKWPLTGHWCFTNISCFYSFSPYYSFYANLFLLLNTNETELLMKKPLFHNMVFSPTLIQCFAPMDIFCREYEPSQTARRCKLRALTCDLILLCTVHCLIIIIFF